VLAALVPGNGEWCARTPLANATHTQKMIHARSRAPGDTGTMQQVTQKKIDVVVWDAGDWIELYVDGRRVPTSSGHSIDGREMLELLGIPFTTTYVPDNEDAFVLCGVDDLAKLQGDLESGAYRDE
jgi:hypothetical protein